MDRLGTGSGQVGGPLDLLALGGTLRPVDLRIRILALGTFFFISIGLIGGLLVRAARLAGTLAALLDLARTGRVAHAADLGGIVPEAAGRVVLHGRSRGRSGARCHRTRCGTGRLACLLRREGLLRRRCVRLRGRGIAAGEVVDPGVL